MCFVNGCRFADLPELTEITLLEDALQNMVEMKMADIPALMNAETIQIKSGVLAELKSLKYGESIFWKCALMCRCC